MIHQYKNNGYNIVLDINSGSVHVVDDVVYDVISLYESTEKEAIVEQLLNTYKKEDIIDKEINKIIEEWNKKTDDEKKSELIYDEAFETLISNSNKAWGIARKRAETGEICKDEKLYEEIKYILEKDHSDIKKFNKKYIKNHVSEGLLDLDYGFGKSNAVSLRVGRYML